jgi:hypothetical protein
MVDFPAGGEIWGKERNNNLSVNKYPEQRKG